MSDVKQVKVDNWGIYFLQRLKHFFNRTDYCDLTLQFQDNAQLKVHRLVLNACTEYFELLERTCEMYEDCLVMPDDLQADVVVPIVNFMYTGHLEFKMDILERLYQTSQILNMPVLSKLLESHRNLAPKQPAHSYSGIKKFTRQSEPKPVKTTIPAGSSNKRSYSKAFDNNIVYKDKKTYQSVAKPESINISTFRPPSPVLKETYTSQKSVTGDPRPTRYEVPEELDTDNIFGNSFCSISYTSQPIMVHPDTVKRYKAKRNNVFSEASGSKKTSGLSTIDIVECKRISPKDDNLFDDNNTEHHFNDETEMFNTSSSYMNNEKDPNQLFDQILDVNDGNGGPKVTIETKDSKAASNLDHARIISEVLKKYPHLVKSNKNIKLKILDPVPSKARKQQKQSTTPAYVEDKQVKFKTEQDDFTYETDVIDSKQAAKLIAMGAENIKGPWICLICGTPGKALHFNSYYKFRRHLVEVHNEKPVANICEYCGLRSLKRNYLLHHLYAQHGVQPPPQYHFPKCNLCTYIALTDALLVKHKLSHKDVKNFRCNVCFVSFSSSNQLLLHIQNTGHKYSGEKKTNLQCIYCLKMFLRETNLYAHIKTHHKQEATSDCIIDDSDDEKQPVIERPRAKGAVKFEPSTSYDNDYEEVDLQYPIQCRPSADKQVPARRQHNINSNAKQKILNPGFGTPKPALKAKPSKTINQTQSVHNDFFQDVKMPEVEPLSNIQNEEIVLIDNNEYILRDHQLIPKKRKPDNGDYIISDIVEPDSLETIQQPTTSMEYTHVQNTSIEETVQQQSSMVIKKSANLNQPIQIVVSNEEEYKALMASNHPIIFDDGGTNKTLTVLTAPHNQAIETTAIDLDNTSGNEMMILPHEYPLNVSEAVATENSNIVVVYSHPVDDQNKQFQILTTGGIGAQFVTSSAIITQNYETVTTSTPAMNTHCIETQVEQTWQNNIQSLGGQQIQLPAHTVMLDTNQVVTTTIHSATENNLNELPEVHLVPETQKGVSPGETDVELNQLDVTNEHVNQPVEQKTTEENVPGMSLIQKETTLTVNETLESLPQAKTMPDIQNNHKNIEEPMEMENMLEQPPASEHVMEQPMETEFVQEQPIQTENVLEQPTTETEIVLDQPMNIENVIDQPIETEYVIEQPLVAENVMVMEQPLENEIDQTTVSMMEQRVETRNMMEAVQTEIMIEQHVHTESVLEQPINTGNILEQPIDTGNILEQPIDTGNVLERPINTDSSMEQPVELVNILEQPAELENVMDQPVERENVIEQPIETECLTKPSLVPQNPQKQTVDSVSINKYSEEKPENDTSERQPELMESQIYDDIVVINPANDEEQQFTKVSEKKIKDVTLDWSEDEYDVAEDGNRTAKGLLNKDSQNQPLVEEIPEVEESIENIQQEMQKQVAANLQAETTADLKTATTATTYLPNVADVDTEQSISTISSHEEDSSSQELRVPPFIESPVHAVVPNPVVQQKLSLLLNDWEDNDSQEEQITVNVDDPTSEQSPKDTSVCSPEIPEEVPKTIKSLVSDWDDDEEETKE